MGFPIADVFSIRYFLLAGAQTCQLFVNALMATHNRSKETNSDFIGSNLPAEPYNFKRFSIEREVILTNTIFN